MPRYRARPAGWDEVDSPPSNEDFDTTERPTDWVEGELRVWSGGTRWPVTHHVIGEVEIDPATAVPVRSALA